MISLLAEGCWAATADENGRGGESEKPAPARNADRRTPQGARRPRGWVLDISSQIGQKNSNAFATTCSRNASRLMSFTEQPRLQFIILCDAAIDAVSANWL